MNQISKFCFVDPNSCCRSSVIAIAFVVATLHMTNLVCGQDGFSFDVPPSWPQDVVTFDSQVHPASLEANPSQSQSPASPKISGSFESMVDAAGPTLSNFKETIANGATGLIGAFTGKSVSGSSANLPRMFSSLALVLGVYFALVWVLRKASPSSNSRLPAEVVEVLGRTPFGPKQTLQLVRLGNKLVLLLNGPEGTHPISEIADPEEVAHLSSRCGVRTKSNPLRKNNIDYANRHSRPNVLPSTTQIPLLNNEQVTQSLTHALRTLENAARQPIRHTTYEA